MRPAIWGSLAVGTASLVGFFVLHHPIIFLTFSVLSFGFFVVSFIALALARKGLEADRRQQLGGGLTSGGLASEDEPVRAIKRLLSKAQYEEATGALAERGVAQADQAIAKMKSFRKILAAKFDPREFTSARYGDAAREVYLSVFASLEQVSGLLTGMATLKSGELFEGQKQEVIKRLELNEKGLLALDEVTAALSRIDTGRGLGSQDLDSALAQLKELAARAEKYSKTEGK